MINSLSLSSTVPAAAARKNTPHQLCVHTPAALCSPVGSEMMSSTDLSWKEDNAPSLVPMFTASHPLVTHSLTREDLVIILSSISKKTSSFLS